MRLGWLVFLSAALAAALMHDAALAAPAFPLKVSANKRYLVDQNNSPFLIMGDSPQSLIGNLSLADADYYLSNRAAAGFNTVWVNLLCAEYNHCRDDSATYDGIPPFTTRFDLSTPNEAYFARADAMLTLAAQKGLLVILDPIETGSWLTVLRSNGLERARNFGRYVGNRYKRFDNIIWMSGNDFQTWQNPEDDALVREVALGILETDPRHIHTVELNTWASGSLDDPTWAPIIQLDAAYSYYPTYGQVLREYNRPNFVPVFMVEANYEFESNFRDDGTPFVLRHQDYWSILSGSLAGELYGSKYTWPFPEGWKANLDTPGAREFIYAKRLFEGRRWYDLVPDQFHTFLTAGYGEEDETVRFAQNTYATTARTPDGTLAISYLPTLRNIAVDLSQMAGPVTAQWYDPTTGAFSQIAGSPFPNRGTREFAPPGNNSAGDPDWVLVLEATPSAVSVGAAVDGASFRGEVAAGSITSVFGTGLGTDALSANSLPLPTSLGSTAITVAGTAAPLFFTSPLQVNFQMPWEVSGTSQVTLVATSAAGSSTPVNISVSPIAPAIFSTNSQGSGQGAVLIADSDLLAAAPGSVPGRSSRAVNRGEFITIYCTGLGDVSNRPATGYPAGTSPLSQTIESPSVTIGGVVAQVSFSGLAPGFVGLYQVNARVPPEAPTGDAVPIAISIGGKTSNAVTIAVR